MLQKEKTIEVYGYDAESLTKGSNKKICVVCDYCGKEYITTMKQRTTGHKFVDKDGCKECKFKKRADVSMAKYGVSNVSQRPEIRQKISEANSDRLKSQEFKEQAKKTNIKKYGVANAMHSETIKEKQKATLIDRYGVDNPSKSIEFQENRKETCKKRFGTEYASQSELGKQLIKDGYQTKYGCDNAFQNEEVKEKIKQTTLEKYGVEHHIQRDGVAAEIQKKGKVTKIDKGLITLYDGQTCAEIAKQIGFSSSHFGTLIKKYGIEKALTLTPHQSSLEVQMATWLDELHIDYQQQFRVDRKIADFYIPSSNLIIECDGLYWHSDAVMKDNNYHFNKKQLYDDNGYDSLFFREDELNNKFDIIKSIVGNKLGLSTSIGARKCSIVELSHKEGCEFFNDNHLMGKGKGQNFALMYEDSPVSVISIKRTKQKHHEVSRFASKLNYNIQGAFSRLLKHAESTLDMETLTTFIDCRYGRGAYLTNMGFIAASNYPSFKWTNGLDTFHRLKFFGNSGYQKGVIKIWDCGQNKFVKTY